MYQIESMRGNS
jgi:hypothetical protein